jgi:hypothetical protein
MTMRALGSAGSLALLVASVWARLASDPLSAQATPPTTARQTPTFSAASDLVSVAATVLVDGDAVTGLGASDFEVLDNGVRQAIESVEPVAMPIDLTLLVDTSRSTIGAFTNEQSAADMRRTLDREVGRIADLLGPQDRLSVIAASSSIVQIAPLGPAGPVDVRQLPTQGQPSAFDGLIGAMLRPAEPGRRQMVVAWTKGNDDVSLTTAAVVRDLARQSHAVVHVVVRRPAPEPGADGNADIVTFGSGAPNPGEAVLDSIDRLHRTWRPFRRTDPTLLSDLARLTGGTVRDVGVFSDPNPTATFREIFDDDRKGYVIRYVPRNVTREGWHEIAIRTPRVSGAQIRARRGYFVEDLSTGARRAAAPPDASRSSPMIAALTRTMETFERGDTTTVRNTFRQTVDLEAAIRGYRSMDHRWPGPPIRSTLFALELGAAGLSRPGEGQRAALQMLTDYEEFVRHPIEPDAFECSWYDAEATAIVASMQTEAALTTLRRALERCPNHGGLLFSRAVAADQVWSTSTGRGRASPASRGAISSVDAVSALYLDAARHADVASEAGTRRAWLLARAGRRDEALAQLDNVQPSVHPVGRYYASMIRAQILRDQGHLETAAHAFETALSHWPRAQSAGVGLLTTWLGLGRREEAQALAEVIQAQPSSASDPWWGYWQGRYTYAFPDMMDRLAKVVR